MSERKLAQAIEELSRQVQKLNQSRTKAIDTWLLRANLVANRRAHASASGFVLPTTVLLILVVGLTVGALIYRAFNTSTRTIANVQNRAIYNSATPAIDRARAKIEYMFDSKKDTRFPGGTPSEEFLSSMMLNDGTTAIKGIRAPKLEKGTGASKDPYTLPDEDRLNANLEGGVDNAWVYRTDTNGDGTPDATVAYSITFSTPPADAGKQGYQRLVALDTVAKAKGDTLPYVRSGPLSNATGNECTRTASSQGTTIEGGWFEDGSSTAILRKNFQVNALVIPDAGTANAGGVTTLELQQDRQLDRGNKWGAWFRNDLEIFPGPPFQWNGAMHTEGSLILGLSSFTAYLISAPNSCVFRPASSSEITVTKQQTTPDGKRYDGLIAAGVMRDNSRAGSVAKIYPYLESPKGSVLAFGIDNDIVNGGDATKPSSFGMDPVTLHTAKDGYKHLVDPANTYLKSNSEDLLKAYNQRIRLQTEPAPYVDDTYRADNRYGPRPQYNKDLGIPTGKKSGDVIATTDANSSQLISNTPPSGATKAQVGLDGYWERRSMNEGLRVLVGQRLEFGNTFGWVRPKDDTVANSGTAKEYQFKKSTTGTDVYNSSVDFSAASPTKASVANLKDIDADASDDEGDPLYPPHAKLTHEIKQRRSMRDNLASVQSAAVYHSAVNNGQFPMACIASTTHPGTAGTLMQSVNFVPTTFKNTANANQTLMTDFFNGRGTNGWEFDPNKTDFDSQIGTSTSNLRKALKNLAQFAGDYNPTTGKGGAFPPTQETGRVYPDPTLTMWGNFSNLRRTLATMDAGTTYANLSPADQTYLHTAACTLGMLAYNIEQVRNFNPSGDSAKLKSLSLRLAKLMDGDLRNGEVLPRQQLYTYSALGDGKSTAVQYGAKTTDDIPTGSTDISKDPTKADDDNATTSGQQAVRTARYARAQIVNEYQYIPSQSLLAALKRQIEVENPGTKGQNHEDYRLAELIATKFQIERDRRSGFNTQVAAIDAAVTAENINADVVLPKGSKDAARTSELSAQNEDDSFQAKTWFHACNDYSATPKKLTDIFSGIVDVTEGTRKFTSEAQLRALSKLCGNITKTNDPATTNKIQPKWPALHYLFPTANHVHNTTSNGDAAQEPYVSNTNVSELNGSLTYEAVAPADVDLQPRATATDADWTLPIGDPATAARNKSTNLITAPDGSLKSVAFLDRVFFDGREWMPARVMDMDIGLMRRTAVGSDVLLPISGIVYAFREDAVREDAIARPPAAGQAYTDARDPDPAAQRDPEGTTLGVSKKPVDFTPDPDRRVHGFRIRNGATVKRLSTLVTNVGDNTKGLSLFSDNPVYIMGDFNLHENGTGDDDAKGTRLEEFQEKINRSGFDQTKGYTEDLFYDRSTPEADFANVFSNTADRWRPSEILADSVTILSEHFCDGSIVDAISTSGRVDALTVGGVDYATLYNNSQETDASKKGPLYGSGCGLSGTTSFTNQNRPKAFPGVDQLTEQWARENLIGEFDTKVGTNDPNTMFNINRFLSLSPLRVSRNGSFMMSFLPDRYDNGTKAAKPRIAVPYDMVDGSAYATAIGLERYRQTAFGTASQDDEPRVNTIMISGIVPSRVNQTYGGLHNFPRFLETWTGKPLWFGGSFLQLNFSNYATGPFDADAWEPGAATIAGSGNTQEVLEHYKPPYRLWGYDVALQLAPAGPAAARFTTPAKIRNEFYSEPALSDPYMSNLCKAIKASDKGKDKSNLSCPS